MRRWHARTSSIRRIRTRSPSGTRASGRPASARCSSPSMSSSPSSGASPCSWAASGWRTSCISWCGNGRARSGSGAPWVPPGPTSCASSSPARGGTGSRGSAAHLSMFYILLQEFIGDLKAQRTRAFLTFFAVTWGTLAVVLLLAFGEGLKRTIRDGLLGAGERIFMIYGGETSKAFAGLGQGRRIRLVEEDLDLRKSAIPDICRGGISYGGGVSRGKEGMPRRET